MVLNTSLIDNILANTVKEEEDDGFDYVKIGLSSSQRILSWSYGEVTKPETINYRTLKPEMEGLFCERVFGPSKDWECYCGKYKRVRHRGIVCERCGVEVTESKVRRHRMGHIKLAAPVTHIWYLKGIPSHLSLLLDLPLRHLEDIAYYNSYVVIDPGNVEGIVYKQLLSEDDFENLVLDENNKFEADMGAPAIKRLLNDLELENLAKELRESILNASSQKRAKLIKRLRVVEHFINSKANPAWMVLDVIPVIPPDLRPMVQLDGGRFATSDLNDLYRRVINRNNRLSRLLDMEAPDIIIRNEKRMLQEAVDALIDNGRRGRAVVGPNNRALKSLSDIIEGKQGRFRQNLLGKRVDYSGRSVIVVGPYLKLHQCGLPKEMALELFKPFVMNKLVERNIVQNIKSAKKKIESQDSIVWDVLEDVIKGHPVMLNRAPTLHRLGIQAFEPLLVEGRAIQLHPLVCTAYNADFDGDQMAVHVPLSIEAQTEARLLMLASNNILLPATGKPIITPSKDMVLGCYYLTVDNPEAQDITKTNVFGNLGEVISSYQVGNIHPHTRIKVRMNIDSLAKTLLFVKKDSKDPDQHKTFVFKDAHKDTEAQTLESLLEDPDFNKHYVYIETTVGRVMVNGELPENFKFVNEIVDKKGLEKIIAKCFEDNGNIKTAELANNLKDLGFHHSTIAGISIIIDDMEVPPEKKNILKQSEEEIAKAEHLYNRGEISAVERYAKTIATWAEATDKVTDYITTDYDKLNSVYMMAFSGARGNISQVRQLVGMRGLMSDPSGKTIDLPIKANFREGLNVTEYVISSYGARKGLVDTALRTADSGYLTRRLADVAQDVIINGEDCGTDNYINMKNIQEGDNVKVFLRDRLPGRVTATDIVHPETDEVILKKNHLISTEDAEMVMGYKDKNGNTLFKELPIRSPLTCINRYGICRNCYGWSLASKKLVDVGEAVGIIAAQSIGEPGTQLTMRTFHTGGVFESKAKEKVFAGHKGKISFDEKEWLSNSREFRTPYGDEIRISKEEFTVDVISSKGKHYKVKIGSSFELKVKNGENVKPSDEIAISWEEQKGLQKERAFREINSDISGLIKFHGFKTEEKKDRQGLVSRTANSKGTIWVHSGDVYSLPSDCELLVSDNQKLKTGDSLGRISTITEYGGKVNISGYQEDGSWKSIALTTAELSLPNPDILLDRKDIQLKFPDDAPLSIFQLLIHEDNRIESGTIIAEAFVDKYVTSTSGEVRYLKIASGEKNTITGRSKLMFLPEETYQVSSSVNPNVEDSCMVEADTEIIPDIIVKESGFVSLENFDLSQSVTFYPGAQGVYFPIENSIIAVSENQDVKDGDLLGELVDPETEEKEPVYCTQKGIVQFIHSEEGMHIVVRRTHTITVDPLKKFFELDTLHESIDLVPVTKLMVRNGDKIKDGSPLVKVNLMFQLKAPLTALGGKVKFEPIEFDEEGKATKAKLKISVVENLSTHHDPSNYGLIGHHELHITSDLQVKEGDNIKPGTIISYTDFTIQSPGKVEIFKDPESGAQKLLIVNEEENLIKLKVNPKFNFNKGDYVFEGDKLTGDSELSESGFVEKVNKNKDEIVIRKAKPYLVSQGAQILADEGAMVQQGEPIAILIYEQVKTGDIVQGLPRVEELLEARKPKEGAILSEYDGTVKLNYEMDEVASIEVVSDEGNGHTYKIPINSRPAVEDGERVVKGSRLVSGQVNPHDILALAGLESVQQFLVDEVQSVYRSQGVEINDKHVEVIVRQMTRKLKVREPGETTLLPGEIINRYDFEQMKKDESEESANRLLADNVLLGITKASLNTESFISAASFQETTRVLTEASIEGKRDWLRGLKENVIIGRLIPAGTGMKEVHRISEMREEASMEMTIG